MSHFTTAKTNLKSESTLKKVLTKLGFEIEENENGVNVRGFFGNTQSADFKILTNTHYDIGFRKNTEGSFELIGDWDLMPRVAGIEKEAFTQHLKKEYARESIMEIAETQGYQISTTQSETDGSLEIVITQN